MAILVRYETGEVSGMTRNISLGGVFVESEHRFAFGARVSVRFSIPTQEEPVEVEGHVRWTEAEEGVPRGFGIQFEGLRARDVWALNKFFEMPLAPDAGEQA